VPLPEADCSDMEFFIDQIRLILPVLGLDFLREAPQASAPSATVPPDTPPTGTLFALDHKKSGLHAEAREIDGDFILLKGSQVKDEWTTGSNAKHGYSKLHQTLKKDGKLQPKTDSAYLVVAEDLVFSSPSAAAAVVLGRPANGRLDWRVTSTQQTYAAWQDEQIAKAEHSDTEATKPA
jgi:hypothetical protein